MSNLSHPLRLVQTLRDAFALTDPRHFCQCGKFCPTANACMPVSGPVHSPYYSVAERTDQHGRRRWAAFLYDPQKDQLYPLNNRWHFSPCDAARAALRLSMSHSPRRPLRLDLVAQHGETTIDWGALENQLAEELYSQGYDLWLSTSFGSPVPATFAHPLIELGYHTARAEAASVLVENGGDPDDDAPAIWELPTLVGAP